MTDTIMDINYRDRENLQDVERKLNHDEDFRSAISSIADHWYMKGHVDGYDYRDNNVTEEAPDLPSTISIASLTIIIGMLCMHLGKVYLA